MLENPNYYYIIPVVSMILMWLFSRLIKRYGVFMEKTPYSHQELKNLRAIPLNPEQGDLKLKYMQAFSTINPLDLPDLKEYQTLATILVHQALPNTSEKRLLQKIDEEIYRWLHKAPTSPSYYQKLVETAKLLTTEIERIP